MTLRCRDLVGKLLDRVLNPSSETLVPVAGAANLGSGKCTRVATKPFETVTETWTLTCTTRGGNGTAVFAVVGSVSGNIGNATSGTQFDTLTNGIGGIRFTISAGTVTWEVNDAFTFQTVGYPQWSSQNPAKIAWGVLTGTNWDTGTTEAWSGLVLSLDPTRSASNADIDYNQLVDMVALLSGVDPLTGYVPSDANASTFLQDLLRLYLGSLYSGLDGRLRLAVYRPTFQSDPQLFADTLQISKLGYSRSINEVLNRVVVTYRTTALWPYSGDQIDYDAVVVAEDTTSQGRYGKIAYDLTTPWVTATGDHASDFANQLLNRYAEPPVTLTCTTGLDASLLNIGDRLKATDAKYGLAAALFEVTGLTKSFDAVPMTVRITGKRDADTSLTWIFLGSSADEGDGESPQASDFDSATATDRNFVYLSQTGGEGTAPDYRLF